VLVVLFFILHSTGVGPLNVEENDSQDPGVRKFRRRLVEIQLVLIQEIPGTYK
jgi:hypothetical protein